MRTQAANAPDTRRGVAVAAAAMIVGLVVVGSLWATARVQDDLTARATAALGLAGLPVTVRYDGLDAVLTGISDPAQAAGALAVVSGVRGTRRVISQLEPAAAPADLGPSSPSAPPGTAGALPRGSVTFGTGRDDLSRADAVYLAAVAAVVRRHPHWRIEVRGHSDDVGSDEINWTLSEQRARAVAAYLVARHVRADQLMIEAFAATRPVASNDTPQGRAANRRVDFAIQESP